MHTSECLDGCKISTCEDNFFTEKIFKCWSLLMIKINFLETIGTQVKNIANRQRQDKKSNRSILLKEHIQQKKWQYSISMWLPMLSIFNRCDTVARIAILRRHCTIVLHSGGKKFAVTPQLHRKLIAIEYMDKIFLLFCQPIQWKMRRSVMS